VYLNGYTSTSLNKDTQLEFMAKDLKDDNPVMLEIKLQQGTKTGLLFYLNTDEFTAYPSEGEILLGDGIGLKVAKVHQDNSFQGINYTTVELHMIKLSKKSKICIKEIQICFDDYIDGIVLNDSARGKHHSKSTMKG